MTFLRALATLPPLLLSASGAFALLSPAHSHAFSSARPRLDLVLATTPRPTTPDPRFYDDAENRPLHGWTHDTLFEWTYLDAFPQLRTLLAAERGTFNAQKTRLTLRLKQGATFSDGEPITARHFIASWRSLEGLPPESMARRTFFSVMRSFRATNSDTLVIEFDRPHPDFEMLLALPFTAPLPLGRKLLPELPLPSQPFAGSDSPLPSSGPFILSAWHPGHGLTLEARKGYSNSFFPTKAGEKFSELPLDSLSSKPIPLINGIRVDWVDSIEKARSKFLAGDADLLELPAGSNESTENLAHQGIHLETGWRPALTFSVLNLQSLPDARLRRRILSLLDRSFWKSISGLSPEALPRAEHPELPLLEDWLDIGTLKSRSTNRRAAPSKRTGSPKPIDRPLQMRIAGSDPLSERILEAARQRLENSGLKVAASNSDLPEAMRAFRAGEVDILITGWRWESPTIEAVVGPVAWLQPEGQHQSTEIRKLESLLRSTTARDSEGFRKIEEYLNHLAIWSPGPRHERRVLVQAWVRGYRIRSAVENPERYLSVDLDLRKLRIGR